MCSAMRKLLCHCDGKERVPRSESGRWLQLEGNGLSMDKYFRSFIYVSGFVASSKFEKSLKLTQLCRIIANIEL